VGALTADGILSLDKGPLAARLGDVGWGFGWMGWMHGDLARSHELESPFPPA
jgi:hypothetical protein